jgi:hypothetical protein
MPPRRPRKALTVRLDPELIARLKRVARDAAGKPLYATLTSLIEAAIAAECDRTEQILQSVYVDPTKPAPKRQRLDTNHVSDRL